MENKDYEFMVFENVNTPVLKESITRGKKWVNYGENNKYPDFLWELYGNCPEHSSIVDTLAMYTLGGGVVSSNPSVQAFFNKVNNDGDTINDVVSKLLLDYNIFGGWCLQTIPNKAGALQELYYVDFQKARVSKDEDLVFYSKDWGKWAAEYDEYPNWTGETKKTQMYYFKGHKTKGIYPIPLYTSAIMSIQTSIEISKFHLNNISNGMSANTIISFNNGTPTDDVKKAIEKDIKSKFGSTSGSKFMVFFNESKDKGVEVSKIDADEWDKKFEQLSKSTRQSIFTAHKVTSPALLGVITENNGFSKEEFAEAFSIFNSTVVNSYQKIILRELEKVLSVYFQGDLGLSIKPYIVEQNNSIQS